MGYERYPRGTTGSYYNREDRMDYGRDYGSGRDYSYSSARDYEAAGDLGDSRREYGRYGANRNVGRDYENRDFGRSGLGYGRNDDGRYGRDDASSRPYAGYGNYRDDNRGLGRDRYQRADYGRGPQGYDYDDRGFFDRAGDEVRSWFGDEDAERRRRMDQRYDERFSNRVDQDRDSDYHSWRSGQIAALDRDYNEYRDENRQKFHNEFATWRTDRTGQRDSLSKVSEHMDVVGSDGAHVGTVDKVRGDRIILTKSDQDAGGRHHSVPSRWIQTVDDKVTLRKTADEAHAHWRDEERNQAFFSDNDDEHRGKGGDAQGRMLNRSFSGTY